MLPLQGNVTCLFKTCDCYALKSKFLRSENVYIYFIFFIISLISKLYKT
jgi:hypothetical protein